MFEAKQTISKLLDLRPDVKRIKPVNIWGLMQRYTNATNDAAAWGRNYGLTLKRKDSRFLEMNRGLHA